MKLPDFFLVGAPKCGTTALADHLKQHPQVFIPRRKELDYFGADLCIVNRPRLTFAEYQAFYADAEDQKRSGDASVWSLYSRCAAEEIRAFCPTASIVIMLRDPVEVMYALHSHNLYTGNETILDFAEALAAEEDRRQGRRLGRRARVRHLLHYRDAVRYTEQVRRYLDVFGRSSVHVIVFEDFQRDVRGVYRGVCDFLGVDPGFEPDFRVVNANKHIRSRLVVSLLRMTAPPKRAVIRSPVDRLWRALRTRVRAWNVSYAPRRPLDPELRRQLKGEWRPEIEALSALLGRDLTGWCRA
jgi:hypothetical protein